MGWKNQNRLVRCFMQTRIVEKAKAAEQVYMLQFLKKLKLYTKLVPETVL